jgi:biotin carboxyl carrier protein
MDAWMGAKMRRLELDVNGRLEVVWAERIQGVTWFHWRGQTHSQPDEGLRARAEKGASFGAHPGKITAPMPGRVTKVQAKPGDNVSVGETLVVLEAMKMEYSLSADLEGRIRQVHCVVGGQVRLGQVLVEVEPKGSIA